MVKTGTSNTSPKRRSTVYYMEGRNGILLKADDNKEEIEELNQWLRVHVTLPRGKYYEFGLFVIPPNEWSPGLTARLIADFEIKSISESYDWSGGAIDPVELILRAARSLGFKSRLNSAADTLIIFLDSEAVEK